MNAVRAYYLAGRLLRAALRGVQLAIANQARRPTVSGRATYHARLGELDVWLAARAAVERRIANAFPAPRTGLVPARIPPAV